MKTVQKTVQKIREWLFPVGLILAWTVATSYTLSLGLL
jgi:hypothetical protein